MLRLFIILTLFTSCVQTNEQNNSEQTSTPEQSKITITKDGISVTSDLTCPFCGNTTTETLPTEYCLIKFDCKKCKQTILPKEGDCCVFCSYGTHKCPSMQTN